MKKHKKLLSLLLCLALTFTMVTVGVTAYAQDGSDTEDSGTARNTDTGSSSSGMEISKTATANVDGTYTIQLEAYATGSKVITEVTEDVPTDIVLVLDQSGSMDNTMSTYSFREYTNNSNSYYYDRRHNGGNKNLYYQLDDGSYVSVSVTVEQGGVSYTAITNGRNNSTRNNATSYWGNQNNLYAVVQGEYQKVTLKTEEGTEWWDYLTTYYVYTLPDGTEIARSSGDRTRPSFSNTDDNKLYLASVDTSKNIYTYSWTDNDGKIHTIGSSTGADTKPTEFTLYERYASGSKTKLQALKDAVSSFADNVAKKAAGNDGTIGTDDDINHTISVVGFANYSNHDNYKNTEVFVGGTGYKYGTAAEGQYSNAPQNMSTANGKANITASINALDGDGATYIDLGIKMANGILNANPVPKGEIRNRVVVIFTDGVPGYSGEYKGASYEEKGGNAQAVADEALKQIDETKNTYGATVYTVGIFEGADASSAGSSSGSDTEKANYFMQKLSSNNGTPQNPSYYLSAGDANTLNNIFQQISDQIESGGSSTTLGKGTVIRDIIAPAFSLPEGANPSNITVETYRCTDKTSGEYTWKKNADAMGATATVNGDQVSVTGFDFAENYVGTETAADGTVTYRGDKLVITFTVSPKDGFLGGNNVYTNTEAGVYENSDATEPVLEFNRPQVNVPIKAVNVTAADKNVYLLGDLTGEQLKEGATVKVGDVDLDLGRANQNYGLELWQTNYVNITVKIKDKDGNSIISLDDLTNDKTYSVSVTVSPKTNGDGASGKAATEKTEKDEAVIKVYKPELTFKDSEVYYGDIAPASFTENKTSEVWKHNGSTDKDVTMIGEKPELGITYTPDASKIVNSKIDTKQDVPVKATVKIDRADVTAYTTFLHQDCNPACGWKSTTGPGDPAFLIHIRTCTLKITKTDGADDEPYVFTVYKNGEPYTEASITGNGSVTIYELPVGDYTIEEDTGWSWRFAPTYSNNVAMSLNSGNPTGNIICTNTQNKPYWLNGFSTVVKNVFEKANN